MAARRIFELRGNVATAGIEDASGRAWSANDIPLIRGDGCIFRISLFSSLNGTAYPLSAGQTLKFGIKDPAAIASASYLAFADNDAFNLSADWSSVKPAEGRICVRFDTDTVAMNTFLNAAGADPKEAIAEIQITEPGEKPFTPLRFRVNVMNDVIRGDEGDPLPSTPTYPTAAEVDARLGAGIQLIRKGAGVALVVDGVEIQSFGAP